jgi:hypothetical protein
VKYSKLNKLFLTVQILRAKCHLSKAKRALTAWSGSRS